MRYFVFFMAVLVTVAAKGQSGTFIEKVEFLADAFKVVPASRVLWLDDELRDEMESILNHAYKGLRVRYWQEDDRTAWILNEVGKEKPITIGVIIDDDRVERLAIMAFRESRGWEVKYAFFTDQFTGAQLAVGGSLDRKIDGITGATLSVRAVTKVSRLALYLHKQVTKRE